jgi:hypothetical protein
MQTRTLLQGQLSAIHAHDDFLSICKSLSAQDKKTVFDNLFAIATQNTGDRSDQIAGFALIELEPKCSFTCLQVIELVANSRWDISNRELPFYLVSQFGKWHLEKEITSFLSNPGISEQQRVLVDSIWYWAKMPSAKLADRLLYWEWQEVIEKNNA